MPSATNSATAVRADSDNQTTLLTQLPALITTLQLPSIYTEIDEFHQQNLPVPSSLQQQHNDYTTTIAPVALHTLVHLLQPTAASSAFASALRLPAGLLCDVLFVLMVNSISIPSTVRSRHSNSDVLSYITVPWLNATNRSLAVQAQRLLLYATAAADNDDDETVLSRLYERHAASLIKRLRARMRGKGADDWKDDVSTAFLLFHLITHLSPTSSTASNLALSLLPELVPLILPLLHSHESRHRIIGCLILSHLLLLLPSYSFPTLSPLLLHTFQPLLSDRDLAIQRVVLPTYVDLLLSSAPPFPLLSGGVEEVERIEFRLGVMRDGHFITELTYLSLSASASVDSVSLHLEQLIRLLVWLNTDVLPYVSALLGALFRFGISWDSGVRERAWQCVGVVMDVGGERMGWHVGKVEERLRLCEVECERQVELNERVSGWDAGGGGDESSSVAREARERSEGWRATKVLVVEMRERLCKRWPRKVETAGAQQEPKLPQTSVSVTS